MCYERSNIVQKIYAVKGEQPYAKNAGYKRTVRVRARKIHSGGAKNIPRAYEVDKRAESGEGVSGGVSRKRLQMLQMCVLPQESQF